ncbi:alpha/beta fold hydrolase [Rivibacter subsaxonicus]|uniref:Pimeloyl-ACP methyl ester carboxylesterase n=1 Tax=Rivibacter subsaxonicus TaxID=457575 RepID=A0A4Q7VN36_9BURK|nr:alpha/beta hydrolase [Rivibacter subsaxonicus]RZT97709.1 pimeloyl-ACP methyl ester carboxylesterase [Rivibacter subsaxonicus]
MCPKPERTSRDAPLIVFSHANGFAAGTYATLFARWRAAGFEVQAIERFGHDPRYPVTSNWPHLSRQLAEFIEQQGRGPAWLVGHSLGGYLSLLTALRQPQLARGVVLLDSPVLDGWRARAVQLAKATGWIGELSPAKVSRRRRERWASVAEKLHHFESKPAFARWDPQVLADYVATASVGDDGSQQLGFERAVETAIYNTLPHQLGRLARRRPPQCPVAFIGGSISKEVEQVGLSATRRIARGRMSRVEGSHLFPMERPVVAADAVLAAIATMGADPAPV